MKNLKQLVLPCYKLEMAMSVEAWYFLHGSTDGVCNLTYLLSLLSKMAVSEVLNTKRGLGYAVHPGQVDRSMLVLAKEWGIGRKAVSRLLEDFSERGLIMNPTHSNPIIEGTGTAETETAATTESEVESTVENAVVDADNTPVLEDSNTLSGSQKWKQPQE
mgnify:FL=1